MTRLMDAFPPSRETQVTLANWRTAPYNRWAFHHVRELIPTAEIANDPERITPLPAAPAKLFDERFLNTLVDRLENANTQLAVMS